VTTWLDFTLQIVSGDEPEEEGDDEPAETGSSPV
jgi:hypothetical protein